MEDSGENWYVLRVTYSRELKVQKVLQDKGMRVFVPMKTVREEKGGTYGVSVSFELNKDDVPNATLAISYKADPQRYEELTPIIYQQLENSAKYGTVESSMQKVKEYLVKQYAQVSITNNYWSYVAWHELDDDTDFDRDYCQMVQAMKPQNVQRLAIQLLDAKRRIEVTMLSE